MRKIWVVIVNIVAGPFIGFCSVGRARYAFAYEILSIGVQLLCRSGPVGSFRGCGCMAAYSPHAVDYIIADLIFRIVSAYLCVQIISDAKGSYGRLAMPQGGDAFPADGYSGTQSAGDTNKWYSAWPIIIALWVGSYGVNGLSLVIKGTIIQPVTNGTDSMSPTLHKGEESWIYRLAYLNAPPRRGDIIEAEGYIRRVVGVTGDRIQVKKGLLWINDVAVDEKRIEDYPDPATGQPVAQYIETLPGGHSHRIIVRSPDDPVNNTEVFTVPGSAVAQGSVFILGDNRSDSIDSRASDVRAVSVQEIGGRISRD